MHQVADFMWSDACSKSERGKFLGALGNCAGSNFKKYFQDIFLPKFLSMTEEYEETQFLYSRLISGNVSLVSDERDLDKFLSIGFWGSKKFCFRKFLEKCQKIFF